MAAFSAEVLSGPLGVIARLVCQAGPALESSAVEEVVTRVAPGRSTRRRLAQALVERPSLLTDGRSPAPRVVGDLLVALSALGAQGISPPRCTSCGKALRSFHRRGEDWYCGVCGPRPLACAVCGKVRKVGARDRAGRPRCSSCPPDDGPEPVEILLQVVRAIDPTVGAGTVTGALERATSRAGQRRQLAWALQDRPELLTGAGAQAPVPSVLRFIDALGGAGATGVVRPACPRCARVVKLSKLRDGLRICRGCEARLRAVPCARCGAVADPVARDGHGGPLCSGCFITDPSNQEVCARCARRRPVSVRGPDGPLCPSCRPLKEMTCAICGRSAPAEISKVTGEPWCRACQQRWARCAGCGQVRPVRGGSAGRPLCAGCTRPGSSLWKACPTCGDQAKLTDGPCTRCVLAERLRQLLGGPGGTVRPELVTLYDNLATAERPGTVLTWLTRSEAVAVLAGLGSGALALSHGTLDKLPLAKPVEHLRAVLVATGALPGRDEHMARLERWVGITVAARAEPEERQLLQRYAVWNLLRRLRRRQKSTGTTYGQVTTVKRRVRAAIGLVDWLRTREVTLAHADQGHLDAWLAGEGASRQGDVGHFIRWAAAQKLTSLELAAVRWDGPRGAIDADKRWEQARWLLHDGTVAAEDRVAGLLVLLYAQRAAAISRLTLDRLENAEEGARLRLGARPVVLPEPVVGLVAELVATRRGHAVLGDQGTSPWLFPGGQPGRPISAYRLTERLRRIGIYAGPARSSALFQLATELPAAVIARMLGVHIKVAVQWQRASSGDWTGYAADYSRRPR